MPRKREPKPQPEMPDPAASPPRSGLARRLLIVALTLTVVAGVVWGVARLGDEARRGIGNRDRYTVHFGDIDCTVPPGLERPAFLSEVRYVSNFPETFQSLDSDLGAKLIAAFAAHPWVAATEGVTVTPTGGVQVKLRFRVPVLRVRSEGRAVLIDAGGVVLPAGASAANVAELEGAVRTRPPAAGQVWRDADVKRAVELVASHDPRRIEKAATGWRLTAADGKTLLVDR
ncbi:unnamed protein product [Gemmataceae bacterium]|nr:unnamed protein product [Gemmataceae bacterium]VTT98595.1 unnamed protein product [Gemmataceae bacterium]